MSIYSVNILSACLSVMLQKALLLMDVVILVFTQKHNLCKSGNKSMLPHIQSYTHIQLSLHWQWKMFVLMSWELNEESLILCNGTCKPLFLHSPIFFSVGLSCKTNSFMLDTKYSITFFSENTLKGSFQVISFFGSYEGN